MQPLINSKGKRSQKDRVIIIRPSLFKSIENTVERGDVVSLISPKNSEECFIKRVIGLPGDVVRTINYRKVSTLAHFPAGSYCSLKTI